MKFNPIKCWLISSKIIDLEVVKSKPCEFKILKKSILKTGFRGFIIEEFGIQSSKWYNDFLIGNKVNFYLDGSGVYRLSNIDLSENEIYLERLNIPIGYKPWIFFSWQSDYNPSRSHIKAALSEAIKEINKTKSPKAIIELVESTRAEDGAKDIVEAIKDNIDKALIIVSDITNVSGVLDNDGFVKQGDKTYPNANVVFETSYALLRKESNQIVLVKRKREELSNDETPFDFSKNRRLEYSTGLGLKESLKSVIESILEQINYIHS